MELAGNKTSEEAVWDPRFVDEAELALLGMYQLARGAKGVLQREELLALKQHRAVKYKGKCYYVKDP